MESVIGEFISQWGPLGILAVLAAYIIYERIRADITSKNNQHNISIKDKDHLTENNLILNIISDFKDNMNSKMDILDRNLNDVKQIFNNRHELLVKRLVNLEDRLKNQSDDFTNNIIKYEKYKFDEHNKKILNQIELGPIIHRILNRYLQIIDCDHIVLGAFHNGSTTLNGIPYCKFDIIAEKYDAKENIHDTDFASIYKNVDLMLHNKLPSVLIQNTYVYFNINEDNDKCILDDLDDILYRRALGRGIRQLAFYLLKDSNCLPIGFIGCIKFNDNKMVEREIQNCAKELEQVYNENK